MTIVTTSLNYYFVLNFGYFSNIKQWERNYWSYIIFVQRGRGPLLSGKKWTCTHSHSQSENISYTAALVSSYGAHGGNTGYKARVEFPTFVKTQKKPYCRKGHSHSLQWSEESTVQLSGLSSRQTPPSIATDCPATAPGGSLEMWVCGEVKRALPKTMRGEIMQDTEQACRYSTIHLFSDCSPKDKWQRN